MMLRVLYSVSMKVSGLRSNLSLVKAMMEEWAVLPTLDPMERHIIEAMRDVARKDNLEELLIFRDIMCTQFWGQIYSSILKARAGGLSAKFPVV